MKTRLNFLEIVLIIFMVSIALALFLPAYAPAGRPKENRFALMQCSVYLKFANTARRDSHKFDFSKLPDETKNIIWIRPENMEFLCKTNFVWTDNSNREVVIVCEKPFSDLPLPTIWNLYRRHPAHAVGYSNGTTGFISPEQFTNLNLNDFALLSSLADSAGFKNSKP